MVEDGGLEVDQRPAGVDAQLAPQRPAGVVEDPQRLGLAARPVEGEGQVVAELLAQGVGGHQLAELPDDLGVPAEAEVGLDAVLGGGERRSSSLAANPQAKSRCENSSSAGPRHSASAWSSSVRADSGSPASSSPRPWSASVSNRRVSSALAPTASL